MWPPPIRNGNRRPHLPRPSPGPGSDQLVATTTANLNVRTSPGIHSPDRPPAPGDQGHSGRDSGASGETWLRITYQGQTAYIAGEYTDLTTIPQTPPVKEPEPEEETPGPGSPGEGPGEETGSGSTTPPAPPAGDPQYRPIDSGATRGLRLVVPGGKVTVATLKDNLNVRAAPGTDSARLGGLPAGSKVRVEEIVTGREGQWLRISYQGRPAYLAAWYTNLSQETQEAPAPGVNEIALSRVNESLYTLTIKGTEPLGGKLRTERGRVILEVTGMDILPPAVPLPRDPSPPWGLRGTPSTWSTSCSRWKPGSGPLVTAASKFFWASTPMTPI